MVRGKLGRMCGSMCLNATDLLTTATIVTRYSFMFKMIKTMLYFCDFCDFILVFLMSLTF